MLFAGIEVPLWAVLTPVATVLAYKYCTWTYDTFSSVGIPGPKPWPLIGTGLDYLSGKSIADLDVGYCKEYGKFCGTFEGRVPVLVVADVEFLRDALVKQQSMVDRRPVQIGGYLDHSIFSISGERWKHVRHHMSPAFTSGKLKKMLPAISVCVSKFVSILKEKQRESVDVRSHCYALTADVIASTAFGLETDTQTNPNSVFMKHANVLVGDLDNTGASVLEKIKLYAAFAFLFFCPPGLQRHLDKLGYNIFNKSAMDYYGAITDQILSEEEAQASGRHDFVQEMASKVIEVKKGDPGTLEDENGVEWSKSGLTRAEVIGNAIIFLLAGFQTTADSLQMVFYELAVNSDIQEKVVEEIEKYCDTPELTVEQLQQLHYVDWVINESLRLYPQGFRFDRLAREDVVINGIHVKKGTAVTASPFVIHRDPELWEEPEEFKPERFSPENSAGRHPLAFIPFGYGNRSCIGNRLALLEMKVCVVKILQSLKVERSDSTPDRPIQFRFAGSLQPKEILHLKFSHRKENQ